MFSISYSNKMIIDKLQMKLIILYGYLIALAIASGEYIGEESEEVENKPQKPKQWALLVAGSEGWWNYRHQVTNAFFMYNILA